MNLSELVLSANTGADAIKRAPIVEEDTGIKCLRIGDVSQKRSYSEWGNTKTTENDYQRYKLEIDDLIVARTGNTIGVNCIINDNVNSVYNNGLIRIKADTSKVIPRYLWYIISSKGCQDFIQSIAFGTSTQPNMKINDFLRYSFEYQDLDVQKKIIDVIDPIDRKIKANEAINRNLSEQVQALYKSWFVDYEPFDGVTPEEWRTGVLKDVLQLRKDGMKAGENTELPYLPIDVIPMNDLAIHDIKLNEEAKSSLIAFNKNDILIGAMRVYFHRVVIAPFDGITRSTCFVLRPYDEEYLGFGLLCCNQNSSIEYAQSTSKGSTMPYAVWENGLGDMDIIIPDKKTATLFNEIVKPMLKIIQQSFYENQKLQGLRESLLPKLMSGELDVSDLDKYLVR